MRRPTRPIRLTALVLWACIGSTEASPSWTVTGATHRIELEIRQPPSQPEAGVVALIPDGGLFPSPCTAHVLDEHGDRLETIVVWHNPKVGLGVCFEPPRSGARAFLYLVPVPRPDAVPTSSARLKPSLLMYTAPSGPSPRSVEAIVQRA